MWHLSYEPVPVLVYFLNSNSYYTVAAKVNPKNGMAFNQIGMLLGLRGATLDATYYYIRSMVAATPFEGAEGNFKMLVSKVAAQDSGQEATTLASGDGKFAPKWSPFLSFVKCCVLDESLGEEVLLSVSFQIPISNLSLMNFENLIILLVSSLDYGCEDGRLSLSLCEVTF
jgi:hypothetical protein